MEKKGKERKMTLNFRKFYILFDKDRGYDSCMEILLYRDHTKQKNTRILLDTKDKTWVLKQRNIPLMSGIS